MSISISRRVARLALAGVFSLGTAVCALANTPKDTSAAQSAQNVVAGAIRTVKTMEATPKLKDLLARSKGVFIVPSFTRGALVVGGRSGEGVLLVHNGNGSWSDPVFYGIGGISVGAQVGGGHGEAAFLLMTDNSLGSFKGGNNFSLNAGSGFTIVRFSRNQQSSWGKGAVVFWTNTAGAYAGGSVSGTDISWDGGLTKAYYRDGQATIGQVLDGKLQSASARPLQEAMPA
ncbi:MAG TPA: lipid-binding SYLF domain-containing protein [Rhizomicrobium sp.]|jgi:lipid-binding SYLF domain-containing protein